MRDLRRIEPEIYKQSMREIKAAVKPLQAEAQSRVPTDPPLSGMAHSGRTGWSKRNARVGINTGGRYSKGGWILVKIRMNGAAGSLFDMAGRGSAGSTPQGQAMIAGLNARYRAASRAIWPAAEAKLDKVQRDVIKAVDRAALVMNTKLKKEWI